MLERIRYGVLLGSKEWTAKMRVLLSGDEREQRALAAARKEGVVFENIAASIAREFGEPWEDLKNRRGHPGAIPCDCLEQTAHRAYLTRNRGTLRRVGLRCRFSSSTPHGNKTSRKYAPHSDCQTDRKTSPNVVC